MGEPGDAFHDKKSHQNDSDKNNGTHKNVLSIKKNIACINSKCNPNLFCLLKFNF